MMPSKDMQSVAALTAQPAMTAPVVAVIAGCFCNKIALFAIK